MVENSECPGFRIRANGEYVHRCEKCSGGSGGSPNFGLVYQGDREIWRNGVLAYGAQQVADARAAGLDPEPVGRGRWV